MSLALGSLAAGAMPAAADELHVFSGGAPQEVLKALAPELEKATGQKIAFTFALVSVITQKINAGEKVDVVLLPRQLIEELATTVPLRTEGRTAIARVGIGVIAREGAAKPDISSAQAVRAMLLGARKVALPDLSTPSGSHLARLMGQLGIADALTPKIVNRAAIHGGGELVASGEADVGLYLVSEVRHVKGVSIVGLLPAEAQSFVVYGSAIPASNTTPERALAFIKLVTDPARGENWKARGFELLPP